MKKRHFISGGRVACDTETTGLSSWKGARPYMFTFANAEGGTAVFEFPVNPYTREVDYSAKPKTFKYLREFFADRAVEKIFHNGKFDCRMIEAAGIVDAGEFSIQAELGLIGDTEFKLRLCDSGRNSYELKPACRDLFDIPADDQKELQSAVSSLRQRAKHLAGFAVATEEDHGDGANSADYWLIQHAGEILVESLKFLKTYQNASPNVRARMETDSRRKAKGMKLLGRKYGVADAERTILLDVFLEDKLDEYGIRHIYEEEMKEIWPVIYAIETRGVHLDRRLVKKGRRAATRQLEDATAEIEKLCRKAKSKLTPATFPNSHPQKVQYFINELQLEPLHENKDTGNPKLDKTFLEYYENTVPMCGAIQRQGKSSKAISTYYDNYLWGMDELGTLHGSFQQIGAKTGRLSSRNPNLQNVPKRGNPGDIMLEVRRPFGPRPGHVWYMYDFKQIEARIFADEANEETMLESFKANSDVYQDFADVIGRETGLEVSRQHTKSIFLGKLYGLGLNKMVKAILDAAHETIDAEAAHSVIDCFNEQFPGVVGFMHDTIRTARRNKCVHNRYGQRIDVDPTFAYTGVNYIIQSSAARLMKRAMVKCHRFLQELGFGWLVMTIHDELIFEFELDRRPRWVLQKLADLMGDNEGKFELVTTPVDVNKTTGTWLEPVPVEWIVSV